MPTVPVVVEGDLLDQPVEVIVNHETRSLSGGSIRRATEKVLERKLEHWLPHDRKAARAAVDRGKPLSEISASGSLARAFTRLAAHDLNDALSARCKPQVIDSLGVFCFVGPIQLIPDRGAASLAC